MKEEKKRAERPPEQAGKREKLLAERKAFPLGKAVAVFLVIALPLGWFLLRGGPEAASGGVSGTPVADGGGYPTREITMTPVAAVVAGGAIELPVEVVKARKIVYFEYTNGERKVPLMAYLTPSGKLVTAVSLCEPCRSTKFHIDGADMVCNACFTRWTLESLKGVSGGCLAYPPEVVTHNVEAGTVKIPEAAIKGWQPRV